MERKVPPLLWKAVRPSTGPAVYRAMAGNVLIGFCRMSMTTSANYCAGITLPDGVVAKEEFVELEQAKAAVQDAWEDWYARIHEPPKQKKN